MLTTVSVTIGRIIYSLPTHSSLSLKMASDARYPVPTVIRERQRTIAIIFFKTAIPLFDFLTSGLFLAGWGFDMLARLTMVGVLSSKELATKIGVPLRLLIEYRPLALISGRAEVLLILFCCSFSSLMEGMKIPSLISSPKGSSFQERIEPRLCLLGMITTLVSLWFFKISRFLTASLGLEAINIFKTDTTGILISIDRAIALNRPTPDTPMLPKPKVKISEFY